MNIGLRILFASVCLLAFSACDPADTGAPTSLQTSVEESVTEPGDSELHEDGGAGGLTPARCPRALRTRTPEDVALDHFAALAAQDWESIRCSYRRNAFVITDGGVLRGREEIVAGWQAFTQVLNATAWTINRITVERDTAVVLYEADSANFSIPDGADTFVVRNGRIDRHTVHGFPQFSAPSP